jgi:hypothetical protein
VRLELLEGVYAAARFGAGDEVPAGLLDGRASDSGQGRGSEGEEFVSVTRTGEELSVVAPLGQLHRERPPGTQYRVPEGRSHQIGSPLRAFRVAGTLEHDLTGVLVSLAAPLADVGVPIFAVSTFDTDYVLVPEDRLDDALTALRNAGHEFDA